MVGSGMRWTCTSAARHRRKGLYRKRRSATSAGQRVRPPQTTPCSLCLLLVCAELAAAAGIGLFNQRDGRLIRCLLPACLQPAHGPHWRRPQSQSQSQAGRQRCLSAMLLCTVTCLSSSSYAPYHCQQRKLGYLQACGHFRGVDISQHLQQVGKCT